MNCLHSVETMVYETDARELWTLYMLMSIYMYMENIIIIYKLDWFESGRHYL